MGSALPCATHFGSVQARRPACFAPPGPTAPSKVRPWSPLATCSGGPLSVGRANHGTYPPLNPPLLRLASRIRAACGAFCPAVPLLVPASSVLPRVPIPDQPSVRTSPPRQASPLAILARRAPTFRLSVSDRAESALTVFAHAPASSCAYKCTNISKNYWLQARRSRLIQTMTLRSCLKRSCTDGASLAGASSCTACPNGTYASTTGRPTAG